MLKDKNMTITETPWLKVGDTYIILNFYVQPGVKKTETAGTHGEALKIRLAAPPVEGKANAALLKWVANSLDVSKGDVLLLSGEKSREKRIQVNGKFEAAEVIARLLG